MFDKKCLLLKLNFFRSNDVEAIFVLISQTTIVLFNRMEMYKLFTSSCHKLRKRKCNFT